MGSDPLHKKDGQELDFTPIQPALEEVNFVPQGKNDDDDDDYEDYDRFDGRRRTEEETNEQGCWEERERSLGDAVYPDFAAGLNRNNRQMSFRDLVDQKRGFEAPARTGRSRSFKPSFLVEDHISGLDLDADTVVFNTFNEDLETDSFATVDDISWAQALTEETPTECGETAPTFSSTSATSKASSNCGLQRSVPALQYSNSQLDPVNNESDDMIANLFQERSGSNKSPLPPPPPPPPSSSRSSNVDIEFTPYLEESPKPVETCISRRKSVSEKRWEPPACLERSFSNDASCVSSFTDTSSRASVERSPRRKKSLQHKIEKSRGGNHSTDEPSLSSASRSRRRSQDGRQEYRRDGDNMSDTRSSSDGSPRSIKNFNDFPNSGDMHYGGGHDFRPESPKRSSDFRPESPKRSSLPPPAARSSPHVQRRKSASGSKNRGNQHTSRSSSSSKRAEHSSSTRHQEHESSEGISSRPRHKSSGSSSRDGASSRPNGISSPRKSRKKQVVGGVTGEKIETPSGGRKKYVDGTAALQQGISDSRGRPRCPDKTSSSSSSDRAMRRRSSKGASRRNPQTPRRSRTQSAEYSSPERRKHSIRELPM